jgi:hypothetical protein
MTPSNRLAAQLVPFALAAACATAPAPSPQPARDAASRTAAPAAAVGAPGAAAAGAEPERFDRLVREDFFAGLGGDAAALDRAMKLCEDRLAAEPDHPEALVWHGAGLVGRAGTAFAAGDRARAMSLWNDGLAEMDRAVALAPDVVGTLIPRGAVHLAVAPHVPDPDLARALVAKGVGDYERALALQAEVFDTLSVHARGQLLHGLAEGHARMGDRERAAALYRRLAAEAPGTPYAERAERVLAGEKVTEPMACDDLCHG